ncbi:T9SS type B sorting domain-containing protein [Cryomorpha ignava]|uniref:T9SS type B sorting domain-containing protein n=1 Tax=Cryomorpha ignava TaxID=101383 RepID=A0A7K3WVA4_9FLAO|nr:gliding motility-associated C-terminal domain-containing protein [Cryomorpha ignava]NEN25458.1 T9SS type B sorting domain-containing protein [Cryomorpha ignava]
MKYSLFLLLLIAPFLSQAQIDTEFWFGAPDLTKGTGSEPRRDSTVYIVVSTLNEPSTVIISQPANLDFEPITVSLAANSVQQINLGTFLSLIETKPANSVLNTGLLIRATKPITAYYEVRSQNNTDLWSLKGKNSLGLKFYVPFQTEYQNNQSLNGNPYIPGPRSGFIVMASKNNTTVSITPTIDILDHPGGETFTVLLNRGQTYFCEALDGAPANHPGGSLVESDKEITVTIKDDMVDVDPSNDGGADVIGDQLVAYQYLGTQHILIDGSLNNDSDRGVICATEDNTEIFIDGSSVTTLNAGEQYMFSPAGAASFIEGSAPIVVLQITGASDQIAGAVIPPLGCTGSNQVGFVRSTNGPFFLNLTIRSGSENQFQLNGNASLIPASAFSEVPGSNGEYVFAQIQYSTGQIPSGQANIVTNFSDELFHLGITNRSTAASANFGYFSAFSYLNIGKNFEVCLNDSVVLDAGPGKTAYNWSTGDTTQTTTVYEPGTYYVEVFSGTDCFAIDSINVEYYELPIDLGPNDTICENTSLTLSLEGFYNFTWQDGSTENFFEVTEPGIYYVDVSDFQGCALRDSIEIAVSPRPETPELTGETTYCEGETIELFMNDFENANYRYILPSGDVVSGQNLVIENAVPAQSGMYYGYYVEEGCETFTDSLEIFVRPMPLLDLGEDISVCSDVPVTIDSGLSEGSFEWSDGSTEATLSPQETGTYSLIYTDEFSCTATDTVEVEFRLTPVNPQVLGDLIYCEGDTIQLSTPDQSNVSFQWNKPDGSIFGSSTGQYIVENATLTASGAYSLIVERSGCFSESVNFTLVVNANPVFTLMSDTTICTDDQVEIVGPAGFDVYAWSSGESSQNITVQSGNFELTVIDVNGCTGSDAVEIISQGPVADFTVAPSLVGNPSTIFYFGDNSQPGLYPINTWLWEFGNGNIDMNQNTNYGYDQSGTFPVTLTIQDELGCEDKTVQVVTVRNAFKIPDGFSPNGDGVNDVFEIQGLDGISGAGIQIFNRWGAVVFESNSYVPGQFWDGKDNTDGTYFYVLKMPNAKAVTGSVTIAR